MWKNGTKSNLQSAAMFEKSVFLLRCGELLARQRMTNCWSLNCALAGSTSDETSGLLRQVHGIDVSLGWSPGWQDETTSNNRVK